MTREQRKNNVRLGLILASVALVLFLGFMAKSALFGI
ncbi:cytochrome oxidase small assembly protein [uncultured Piscinibacter sp.]|nr:cytochrome oxidase small assembly protein [uncultured Piscinibacter sp.]